MNICVILMVILPLFILIYAPVGQNYRIRLQKKFVSDPSSLLLGSPTEEDVAYNEDLKNVFSTQFRNKNGVLVPRSKSKIRKLDWLVGPSTQRNKESPMDKDQDHDDFEEKRGVTKPKIIKNSRNEVSKLSSFIENYKKYKNSYFMRKYVNEEIEKKRGTKQTRKLDNNIEYSEKNDDKNRLNTMLIGPTKQEGGENKISDSLKTLKVNRKLTEQEMKIIMKKFGRAISNVLVTYLIISLIFLLITALVYIFKIFHEKQCKPEKCEVLHQPKSIFYVDIDSLPHDKHEKQIPESSFHVSSEEECKETVLLMEETLEDEDIEETTPLLFPKSTSPKTEKDKYHSSSSNGTETVQTMTKVKSPEDSGSSKKEEEASFYQYQKRNSSYEEDTCDFRTLQDIKTRENDDSSKECGSEKSSVNNISLSNQAHDLYTVHTIKYNLSPTLHMNKGSFKNSNRVTHSGDAYERSFMERGINSDDYFKGNHIVLRASTREELEKYRVDLCTILEKASEKFRAHHEYGLAHDTDGVVRRPNVSMKISTST
ncbi:uncharacterized protein LOC111622496 [Centruroides sculpturatus]|uniref:uncharacterized protein LOC111622496 n=1 Tax=Centruroides sculpturatus TaxID=218467 RepID=UPI000C6D1B9D|nr:uncharacterized protein LOC111622496 [Centruroides sculpturatus]